MRKVLILMLVFMFSALSSIPLFAQESANYVTPDSWRQHYNVNGVKASVKGVSVGDGGNLTLGVTLRDTAKMYSGASDNHFYTYLRGQLTGVKLLDGTVNSTLNLRAATDTSHGSMNNKYFMLYDSLDSSRGSDDWDLRLYQANVQFDQVLKYTTVTAGRYYTDHITDMHLDGGEVAVTVGNYGGYVFYGLPVSYYDSSLNTDAFGGGLELSPFSFLDLRGEVFKLTSDDYSDTLVWNTRGDISFNLADVLGGGIYGQIGKVEAALLYKAGAYVAVPSTSTDIDVWMEGQYDRNDKDINPVIAEFDLVMGSQSQYTSGGFSLYQGVTKNIAVGAGFETRYNYDIQYGDRDYYRYKANVDFIDLYPNNFISLTLDYWDIPSDDRQKANQKLYVGGKVSQIVNDQVEMWLGAALMNYRYYYKQFDVVPAVYNNKKLDNSVYVAYVGVSYKPIEDLLLQLDYMFEQSQVLKDVDKDGETGSVVTLLANYNF